MDFLDEIALLVLPTFLEAELSTRAEKPRLRVAVDRALEVAHIYLLRHAADVEQATALMAEPRRALPPCLPGFRMHRWRPNKLGCERCNCRDVRREVWLEQQRARMVRRRRGLRPAV